MTKKQKVVAFLCSKGFLVGTMLVLAVAATAFAAAKTQLPVELSYQQVDHAVDESFEVMLGSSLSAVEEPSISPSVDGDWHYVRDIFGINGLKFSPATSFRAGQKYEVRVVEASRVMTGRTQVAPIVFTTEHAPRLAGFSLTGQSVVAADHVFSATLERSAGELRDLRLTTKPAVELERSAVDDKTFEWRSDKPLPQGKKIDISLTDELSDEVLWQGAVKVAAQPAINDPVKQIGVTPDDHLVIKFKELIDRQKLPDDAIKFNLPGIGTWASATEYQFVPDKLAPGKTYSYLIQKQLRTKDGGILLKPIKRQFSTRGAVALASFSPLGQEVSPGSPDIRLTFNQPINKKSVTDRIAISSGKLKEVLWEGETLVLKTKKLGYQRRVKVTVAPGVQPVFGLANAGPLSFSFTTKVQEKKLNVPYYAQAYAQSCEAASLRMALAFRGIHSSDWNILQKFGYKPSSKNKKTNTWADPQKQFVGDVNGNQGAGTGWGVYAEPVAQATRSFGRKAVTKYGVTAPFLAEQIYSGRPVILWGIWGSDAAIQTWTTTEGDKASGPFPMHVRLVVGVKGSPERPLGFYVNDPITGSSYWTADQLMQNTRKAGPANQAVVIH